MTCATESHCQLWQHLRDEGDAQADNGIAPDTPEEPISQEKS